MIAQCRVISCIGIVLVPVNTFEIWNQCSPNSKSIKDVKIQTSKKIKSQSESARHLSIEVK